jgi:hypothetical protein
MIRIWKFGNAPQHLRELCRGATDATWVVEIPLELRDEVEALIKDQQIPLKNVVSVDLPGGAVVIFGLELVEPLDQSRSKQKT